MRRSDLVSDCGACAALCCVATSFDASEDFGFDKAAGVPCRHLTRSCSCRIHDDLVELGFPGCAAYDCYGAGQRATRVFVADNERTRHRAFLILRGVHELCDETGDKPDARRARNARRISRARGRPWPP